MTRRQQTLGLRTQPPPLGEIGERRIVHIDMDAFYAAIEQRDDPALRGKPVVVGGSPDSRGVVATASYEARPFGVHSAMACARAVKLCPDAIFVRPRFEVYRSVAAQIRAIFRRYTDAIEPLSLDEAFLDVTDNHRGIPSGTLVAESIRHEIRKETGLTASAGVAPNKFIAKIASDWDKPDGLTVIPPERVEAFLTPLPIGTIFGVGKVTAGQFQAAGIETIGQLRATPWDDLVHLCGSSAAWFYRLARGVDGRPVRSRRARKSVSAEETFAEDHLDIEWLSTKLSSIAREVLERSERAGVRGRTATVKVKYGDFEQITRQRSFDEPLDAPLFDVTTQELLRQTEAGTRPIRLLGAGLSNLVPAERGKDGGHVPQQLELPLKRAR